MEKKIKVEQCKKIYVYPLIRKFLSQELQFLQWQDGLNVGLRYEREKGRRYVVLSYELYLEEETRESFNYRVRLTKTRCNIAGWRYWFVCPLLLKDGETPCRRRASVLYKPPSEKYFGCRHCHNLTYESRSLTPFKRACKLINFLEMNRQLEEFPRKIYKGLRTKKYKSLLKRIDKGLNYMGEHNNAMLERLSKK